MAKEIEILVPVLSDEQTCYDALEPYDHMGSARTIDTYYYDPLRSDLKPDETGRIMACMRIRTKEGIEGGWITHKNDIFIGDIWQDSEESETRVGDPKEAEAILRGLGLMVLTIVNCVKHVYMTPDGSKEIVFEQVDNLGNFLEVENKASVEDDETAAIKEGLRNFLSEELLLEVGEELNAGKPELMLRKQALQPLEV